MDESVKRRLGDLNREFYRAFAASFADTRSEPQPGFYQLEGFLPPGCGRLLDVGCGEGRLGRFLLSRGSIEAYDGIDASEELLAIASTQVGGRFWQRDLIGPDALRGLAEYQAIACLAVLQHIPGKGSRQRLVSEMGRHLPPGGRLLISTWQFLSSERQRRKILNWDAAGLTADMVEENDYLLSWRRDGFGMRYVCHIDETEVLALGEGAGLNRVATFRADGREGDLNLYAVFAV